MPADDRVLLLDMGAAKRSRLAASISRLGYVAVPAADIAAAQAIWAGEGLPIVAVDLRNQRTPIAELRAQMPGCAIIALGGRTLAAALEAWHAGADGYLPWPMREHELAAALEQVLSAHAVHATEQQMQIKDLALTEFRNMAADLARQINAPLTPILGMADLLAEELPHDHPGHAYAQAITNAALRIRDIAWMLRDMNQLEG
jgi:DNA-binding response OmpR family regulator